jgi:hypothetical protein
VDLTVVASSQPLLSDIGKPVAGHGIGGANRLATHILANLDTVAIAEIISHHNEAGFTRPGDS